MRLSTTMLAIGLLAGTAEAQIRVQFGNGPPRAQPVPNGRVFQGPRTYRFGAKQHLDDLAFDLSRQMKGICLEMHYHYQENPGYRETYREAYEMWQLSEHVHELVHDKYRARGEEDHIASDLAELDAQFHHVESDVARWRPNQRIGRGHDLQALMEETEQTLHHAMDDYGTRSKYRTADATPPAPTLPPRPR